MSSGFSTSGALEGISPTGEQVTQFSNDTQSPDSSGSITDGLGGGGVGKNQFLEILMAQLKNQNPLKPQKSGKFVDQMASLTSLEQMTQISDSMKSFQQSQKSQQFMTLLGKNVQAETTKGNTVSGEVESVKLTGDSTSVVIGGQDVGTKEIAAISTVDEGEESS
jgi:flagellar basal-body rod modification protein FlgD